MEDAVASGLPPRIVVGEEEPPEQDDGQHRFGDEAEQDDAPDDPTEIGGRYGLDLPLHRGAGTQAHATEESHGDERRERHDADAPDLDEHGDDDLAEG